MLAQNPAEKKMVLMDFTGSDWCPPCKALEKNVLSSPAFEAFAKENLVLVQVDPEYVFSKAERGKPRIVALDHEAFGATASNLNVMNPIMACFTTADMTLPKVRYICNPELPAMQGTTKVAA